MTRWTPIGFIIGGLLGWFVLAPGLDAHIARIATEACSK